MRNPLASPRRRRRLLWTLGIVGALAATVAIGILYSNTGESHDTPLSTEAAPETTPVEPDIRVTPVVRRQVDDTVQRFVHTAVIRRNLGAAWPLASPIMRQSVTREDWERGDIPVQPFPAAALDSAGWRLRYRNARTLGIDVMVQPKKGSGAPVAVYSVELTAAGSGPPRRFLVDSWFPQTTLGAASAPPEPPPTTTGTQEAAADIYDQGKLGAEWLLVPVGVVLLLIGMLGAFGLRSVLRARRAERAYRERSGR